LSACEGRRLAAETTMSGVSHETSGVFREKLAFSPALPPATQATCHRNMAVRFTFPLVLTNQPLQNITHTAMKTVYVNEV